MGDEDDDHLPETAFERVRATLAEVLIFVVVWKALSTLLSDANNRTKLLVCGVILVLSLIAIYPVYKKRLRS